MIALYAALLTGLVLNVTSLLPVLAIPKTEKKVKAKIAIRLYLLSVFLVISMLGLTQYIAQQNSNFPLWLLFAAIAIFAIMLVVTAKFLRKYLTRKQSQAVILSSFFIIFAVRANAVFSDEGMGYTVNISSIVWTLSFLFACVLAYIACADKHAHAASTAAQNYHHSSSKADASQTEIDYDIWLKGKDVLNDPNLTLVEQQRYKDALKKKDEQDSDW